MHQPPPDTSALEVSLAAVELSIATLGHALAQPDPAAVETAAAELQATMRTAMTSFAQVARRGSMPLALRKRIAMAAGQVAAQREALFRASSVVDQALDILIPRPIADSSVYSATGTSNRGSGRVIAAS